MLSDVSNSIGKALNMAGILHRWNRSSPILTSSIDSWQKLETAPSAKWLA